MAGVDPQHAVDLFLGAGGRGQGLLDVAAGVVVDEFQDTLPGVGGVAALAHGAVETLHNAVHGVGGGTVQVEDDKLDVAHSGFLLCGFVGFSIAYLSENVKGKDPAGRDSVTAWFVMGRYPTRLSRGVMTLCRRVKVVVPCGTKKIQVL